MPRTEHVNSKFIFILSDWLTLLECVFLYNHTPLASGDASLS